MATEWQCELEVHGERKTVVVQVDDERMKQAAAEVKAIKSQPDWQSGNVRCLFSRYLGEAR